MNPRLRAIIQVCLLLVVLAVLVVIFPSPLAFVERAARELGVLPSNIHYEKFAF